MPPACSDSGGLGHFLGLNTNPLTAGLKPQQKQKAITLNASKSLTAAKGNYCEDFQDGGLPSFLYISLTVPQFGEPPHPQRPFCTIPIRCHHLAQSQEGHLPPLWPTKRSPPVQGTPLSLSISCMHPANSPHQKNTAVRAAQTSPSPAGPAGCTEPQGRTGAAQGPRCWR